MNFTLSEDNEALREAARVFLDKEVSLAPLLVPGATVEAAGYDALWSKLVLIMIVGELGRTLAPCPMFGVLAGAWAIEQAGSETQKRSLLAAVAEGRLKLALAIADGAATYDNLATDPLATADGDRHRLTGEKSFVVDAASADTLVVAATLDGRRRYFLVDAKASGVKIELLAWRDITRQVCTVSLDGAPAELLSGDHGDIWPWIRDRLYMLLATESAAVAKFALDDAVAYAKERVAFGRPIGAFQAIKHQLAELAGQAECAAVAAQYAAWTVGADDARAPLACAMAQSWASEAAKDATHRNVQVFGAIGFSWEMKNHLYYKRARANFELLGAPYRQREEVVRYLEREAA
jgi:alkylation response protein AidB-like acyl-CoA dehydrogenase